MSASLKDEDDVMDAVNSANKAFSLIPSSRIVPQIEVFSCGLQDDPKDEVNKWLIEISKHAGFKVNNIVTSDSNKSLIVLYEIRMLNKEDN